MKKNNKKIQVTLTACIIFTLLLGSVKIFGEMSDFLQTDKETEISTAIPEATEATEASGIDSTPTGRIPSIDMDEIDEDLILFSEWVKTYAPSEEAQKTVAELISSGADVNALISLCIFREDTDKPFSIVEEIYSYAPEDVSEYKDHIIWIESTYNRICNIEDEALTIDEVKAYVEDGISTQDIMIANRISRKGEKNIKDVLEERKSGKSWYNLIISEDAPDVAAYEEIGGNNLLDMKIISSKTGQNIDELLSQSAEMEDGELIYNIRSMHRKEVQEELLSLSDDTAYER